MFIQCVPHGDSKTILLNTRYICTIHQEDNTHCTPCLVLITSIITSENPSGRYYSPNHTRESLELKLAQSQQMVD